MSETMQHAAKRERRGGRLVLIVLLAVVVVAGGFVLTAGPDETTTTDTRSVPVEGLDALQVQVAAGDVTIVASDRDDIAVTTERTTRLWATATGAVTPGDGALEVTSGCERAWWGALCRVETTIEVPRDVLDRMELEVDAGSIEVTGTAAEVIATVDAGEIRLFEHAGASANLSVGAGSVRVEALMAPTRLLVDVRAGDVDLVLPDEPYDVTAQVRVGDLDVSAEDDPSADRQVTVTVEVGELSIRAR